MALQQGLKKRKTIGLIGSTTTAPPAAVRSDTLTLEKKSKMLSLAVTIRTTLQLTTNESNKLLPDCVDATYSTTKLINIC